MFALILSCDPAVLHYGSEPGFALSGLLLRNRSRKILLYWMSVILGLRSGCQWVMGSKGCGHLSSLTFSIHVLLSRSTAAHLALLHRLSICGLMFGRIMEYWVSSHFMAYTLLVVTTRSLLSLCLDMRCSAVPVFLSL